MKIGVFGTGMVGKAISSKLLSLGHNVMMGSRTAANEGAQAWLATTEKKGLVGTFADAAHHGELLFNCTNGFASLEVLKSCKRPDLDGKTLIDVSNPLDFTNGFPPTLFICNDDSLAERLQSSHPEVNVVKSLNTTNCNVMVNPSLIPGSHDVFLSGNNEKAKAETRTMLESFGWPAKSIIDLGDLTTARGVEMMLPLWVRLFNAVGTPNFNFHVARP